MSVLVGGNRPINRLSNYKIFELLDGSVTIANATTYRVSDATGYDQFTGNFTYDADGRLNGGTITGWTRFTNGGTEFVLTGLDYPVALFLADLATNDSDGLIDAVLGNNDKITGSTAGDVLSGHDGNDTINGGGTGDLIAGSQGNDSLLGGAGQDALAGGDGNDTMMGGADNDTYNGFEIGDVVHEAAGQGIDEVHTTQTHILGENIENLVLEGVGNIQGQGNKLGNVITGNSGNNQIAGVEGDDTLDGAGGADTMIGGIGNDVYWINDTLDEIQESLNGGTDTARSHVTSYTLAANVENLELWFGGVEGIGNGLANLMLGQNGNNVINGLGGNDTVDSGGGFDSVLGGSGNDSMSGGQQDDTLKGEQGADTLLGGDGIDELDGGADIDLMIGGNGNDSYDVQQSGDKIVEAGGTIGGVDTVNAFADYTLAANVEILEMYLGATVGTGNALDNIIHTNFLAAKLSGLGGDDFLGGNVNDDTLDGGIGDDVLSGAGGSDSLIGGAGADNLDGDTGNDTMAGDAGDDLYFVDSTGDVVQEGAGQGFDTIISMVDYALTDELQVESLLFTDLGTGKSGQGNKFANYILGNSLDNTLQGGNGNDTLQGAVGADSLLGGKGDDIYFVTDANDKIVENSGEGLDHVTSTIDFSLLALGTSVENLGLSESGGAITGIGSNGANAIIGNSKNNILFGLNDNDSIAGLGGGDSIDGGAGNDSLLGGDGYDELKGESGDDTMIGGKHGDTYFIDSAKDVVIEAAEIGVTDRIISEIDIAKLANNVEDLTLGGPAVTGVGNSLSNVINGGSNDSKLFGVDGDDFLLGLGGNDTLDGGAGRDRIDGGTGDDSMIGGAGDDVYWIDSALDKVVEQAGAGSDQINSTLALLDLGNFSNVETLLLLPTAGAATGIGNKLDNTIFGNADKNKLSGHEGNDQILAGLGDDTMDGGTGDDTYYIDDLGDVVIEGNNAGKDTIVGRIATINLSLPAFLNIENVIVDSGGADAFGNALANQITGNGADNYLTGGDGNDTLSGERSGSPLASNDTLDGAAGNDLMTGGGGDDQYWVFEGGDKIVELAGQGKDSVLSFIDYVMAANVESLFLSGSAAKGTGNASDNTIDGNGLNNVILGVGGNDSLLGDAGNDTLDGGVGDDKIEGGDGGDKLIGGAGLNRLFGDAGNDSLVGGAGIDTLDGGIGVDTMAGGGGGDAYYVDNKNDAIMEAAGQGADYVFASVDYTLPANVETLYVTGTAVTGTGNAGANSILGNGESNMLIGLAGNDTFFGGIGGEADTMVGGAGNDLYSVDTIADVVDEDPLSGGGGIDTVVASVSISLASLSAFVENVRLIGSAKDASGNGLANVIEGTAGNNSLFGASGADTLIGGDGLDSLGGGAGLDVMIGGNGSDYYAVDLAGDKVIEGKGGGIDTVEAFVDYTLAAEVEILNLTVGTNGTGNALGNLISGNPFANKLSGVAGNDVLHGGGGNDTLLGGDGIDLLFGEAGNDSMAGGIGNDQYFVDDLGDIVIEIAGQGSDQVNSTLTTYTLADNVEQLLLVGPTGVSGFGNGLSNVIVGSEFGNALNGGDGNDTLNGIGGVDILTGGSGRDVFRITNVATIDIVADFDVGPLGDTLDLRTLLPDYIAGVSDPDLFVQFVTVGSDTTVQTDADGAGGGSTFEDAVVLEGVILNNVSLAVLEGNLLLD